jgi:CRISPR-associated protein Cmr4
MNTKMYWLHAITPSHVGTGTGAGFIDLPIMREKTTGWPLVPGSAIKGVQRDDFVQKGDDEERRKLRNLAFGSIGVSGTDTGANSGAIVFTDARIVCLPVASYYGTFAWVTSKMVLRRAKRDASLAGTALGRLPEVTGEKALVPCISGPERSVLLAQSGENTVYLTDLDLPAEASDAAVKWSKAIGDAVFPEGEWRREFQRRFIIAPDETFNYLSHAACEVQARVKISDDTKTVQKGQLWYEEALPAESILNGLVWCDRIFDTQAGGTSPGVLLEKVCSGERTLQIGGKATVGRGRMRCVFTA